MEVILKSLSKNLLLMIVDIMAVLIIVISKSTNGKLTHDLTNYTQLKTCCITEKILWVVNDMFFS